jgi:oligopeptide/dipeptide ABC transporter ATP-binding protein
MNTTVAQETALVRIEDAHVTFGRRGRSGVQAVAGVDLEIASGEVLAVVGESGSGKSTLARTVVGLQRLTSGSIRFPQNTDGDRRVAQMVFQDPRSSLNPKLTIRQIVQEAWPRRDGSTAAQRSRRITELLEEVGIGESMLDSRPADLSGGQCQRISIARALLSDPRLLVCDEVVSALDVSIQAQVLDLLRRLQEKQNLAMLFITHDLGVVRQLADRVAVMYLGKIVEVGPADEVFGRPTHPYTQALLSSAVDLASAGLDDGRVPLELGGTLPSPSDPPAGCRLHPRCWKAQVICSVDEPALEARAGGMLSACHFAEPIDVLAGS